ncbi:MAG: hypothetical protein QG588_1836, partial [Candidatus Poribacteria bacterium]|nr:hypothetical protein [Candidatus Poribacteria bacterium]
VCSSDLLEQLSGREPSIIEMIGVSGSLQNFYNGVEKIFERIILALYGKLPEGEEWHTMLLQQIESNSIIDHSLFLRLLDYLRFRHRHRHSYGHTLEWARLLPLARDVSDTSEIFRKQIYSFLESYSNNS